MPIIDAIDDSADCEDQGGGPTDYCMRFECQWWEGQTQKRPALVLVGKYWCCPKCRYSYGEHAKAEK